MMCRVAGKPLCFADSHCILKAHSTAVVTSKLSLCVTHFPLLPEIIMFVRLIPFFVLGIIATIGSSHVAAEATYFRSSFELPLNGTSWRTSMPLPYKCANIVIVPQHSNFSATRSVRYTILGAHGVRLADGPGAAKFFAEEPTGNYTIVANGLRIPYRHLADDKQTWRTMLADVLAGRPQLLETKAETK